MGFAYRDYAKEEITHYYYVKNLFGDVVELWRASDNTLIAKYVYDVWGKHKVYDANGTENTDPTFIGNCSSFRYRGYYWDREFNLYYLKTRYYDPALGRFISADDISDLDPESIQGLNLYAYCENNPVMGMDPDGTSFTVFLVGALIGFAVSFGSSVVSQAVFNEDHSVDFGIALVDGLFGAFSGALWMVPGLGPAATGFINAGLTAINGVITTGMENNWNYSLGDFVNIGISSVLSGVVSGASRNQFLKAGGKRILSKTHKLVGTIGRRIVSGHYNNGSDVFSKSFKSAAGQMFGSLAELNFSRGFYVDWLITDLQAMFSTAFSRGVKSLVW